MKKKYSSLLAGVMMLAAAEQNGWAVNAATLSHERLNVIHQYVEDLQKADYKDITALFEPNGYVVSNSHGKTNAKEFFYAFLPNIVSAQTSFNQTFSTHIDKDRLAVRFHFKYAMKDGEQGEGEYIDEFVFTENSLKIASVAMFENLKYPSD